MRWERREYVRLSVGLPWILHPYSGYTFSLWKETVIRKAPEALALRGFPALFRFPCFPLSSRLNPVKPPTSCENPHKETARGSFHQLPRAASRFHISTRLECRLFTLLRIPIFIKQSPCFASTVGNALTPPRPGQPAAHSSAKSCSPCLHNSAAFRPSCVYHSW